MDDILRAAPPSERPKYECLNKPIMLLQLNYKWVIFSADSFLYTEKSLQHDTKVTAAIVSMPSLLESMWVLSCFHFLN